MAHVQKTIPLHYHRQHMMKHAGSNDNEPSPKCLRTDQKMEDAFFVYLSDWYSPDDWAEARDVLQSKQTPACQPHMFNDYKHDAKASEDEDEDEEWEQDEEEEEVGNEDEDHDGTSVWSPWITQFPGTLAKERLATTIADIVTRLSAHHLQRYLVVWYNHINITPIAASWKRMHLLHVQIPISFVQWMNLTWTLEFTNEKGYDVRPGDAMSVVCGSEYQVTVPIRFVVKICNTCLDAFCNNIGQVFIIQDNQKGYQATLYSFNSDDCIIALSGQPHIYLKLHNIITRSHPIASAWSAIPENIDMLYTMISDINPSPPTNNP
ncbi:hypothetical protein BDR05DRAFT_947921 [Suillus weaverae]|nr:hypothetical protein BDR05DRAFT_947921 [Suillus weaverae]